MQRFQQLLHAVPARALRALAVLLAVGWLAAGSFGIGTLAPHSAAWLVDFSLRLAFLGAAWWVVGQLVDSRRRRAAHEDARVDRQTGLVQRDLFFRAVDHETARRARYHRPFTLAYLGIDELGTVAYRHGTEAADELLHEVGRILLANLRQTDTAARIQDTEFAILLPETDATASAAVCRKLQDRLTALVERRGWPARFSIGAVTPVGAELGVRELAQRAYQRLHLARTTTADGFDQEEIDAQAA